MINKRFNNDAQSRVAVAERCLIAADVDKTILEQGCNEERELFLEKVAPGLVNAAAHGTNLAFLTGNSMDELSHRVLKMLVEQLCFNKRLALLEQFHFFCNSGGVYAHFSSKDEAFSKLLLQPNPSVDDVLGVLTVRDAKGEVAIHPRFIDASYIERCKIPVEDEEKIQAILEDVAGFYREDLDGAREAYEEHYDLSKVLDVNGQLKPSQPNLRRVSYGSAGHLKTATNQITLKPVLSFRHAKDDVLKGQLFDNDLRTKYTQMIQEKLIAQGADHYVARPGGTSSIDVTLEKLDKAYALEFLIDRLNLQGSPRSGKKYGSNTIYFGDEVIVGQGNDYPVTRIPGLFVLAVNSDRELVPFHSRIFVPSITLEGPDATAEMLSKYNSIIQNMSVDGQAGNRTVIDLFKEELFVSRIKGKVATLTQADNDHLSVADWQTLHTIVTLMNRRDPAAREWISLLTKQLDGIMLQLENGRSAQAALGAGSSRNVPERDPN